MRQRLEVQPVNVGSGGHISTKKNGSYVARRTRCQSHPAIARNLARAKLSNCSPWSCRSCDTGSSFHCER